MSGQSPFQISIQKNEPMKCHDLLLQVGNLTEAEAKILADALSDWIIEGSKHGWKARVQ